ncbi:MAG TPA: SPOR domain-containing protein [Steroidobacteraceae bacterium]|nr:SPOR domain-containing protein [Steroidobacteraceae bacterium]
MRIAFFVLLAANLIYLAWAGWIDVPDAPAVVAKPGAALPVLQLASESGPSDQTQFAPSEAPTAQRLAALASNDLPLSPAPSTRCVSVGPFSDLARAARGAALLRDRGFAPKQRAEPGEMWAGFWVYVGGLKSAAEEAKVVKTLERAGINDAHAMPEGDAGRRVSVGLFTEKERAEKRAAAVKRLGYTTEIVERKQPATVYWVDLQLGANDRTVPTEGLLSEDDAGARLEIRVCPGSEPAPTAPKPGPLPRDARPAATTADAGTPRPG